MSERESMQLRTTKALSALSHPTRRRMMDVLNVYGPQTVSAIAERTGQSPANASHHLKVLAESGLVEQTEGDGDRRERWWKRASEGFRWNKGDFADDEASNVVATAAQELSLQRQTDLARAWFQVDKEEWDRWEQAPFSSDSWLRLTPAELSDFHHQLEELIDTFKAKATEGDDREPVFLFAYGIPGKP